MTKTKEQIIEDIRTHIQKRGGAYGEWYVGIGVRVRERLFMEHKVRQKGDHWIHRRAVSPRTARDVLDYFANILSTDCGTADLQQPGDAVYAYRKTAHTRP
ncbi:MAG: hypothetical protein AMXMBFR83_28600 [Phycisphaerae bacterium]